MWIEATGRVQKDADHLFKIFGDAYAVLSDTTKVLLCDEFGISPLTVKALSDSGYVYSTVVQEASLSIGFRRFCLLESNSLWPQPRLIRKDFMQCMHAICLEIWWSGYGILHGRLLSPSFIPVFFELLLLVSSQSFKLERNGRFGTY